jgi:hypothetical protein
LKLKKDGKKERMMKKLLHKLNLMLKKMKLRERQNKR